MRLISPNALKMSRYRSRAGYASIYALLLSTGIVGVFLWGADGSYGQAQPGETPSVPAPAFDVIQPGLQLGIHQQAIDVQAVLNDYCVVCHNERRGTANLAFDTLDASSPGTHPATWEKVVTKLRAGTMPPGGQRRPDPETYAAMAGWLETELDAAWAANPYPGRIAAIHRDRN